MLDRTVSPNNIPEALAKINFIFFRQSDDFDSTFAALAEALNTDLEWKRLHTRLLMRAKEWEQKHQESSFLLRGKDLFEAEEWLERSNEKEPKPITLQSKYLRASRRAATKRQRIILAAVTFALVVAVVLALVAWQQQRIAKQETAMATSRALAAQAEQVLSHNQPAALNLALQGWQTASTAEAHFAVADSFPQVIALLKGHTDPVVSAVFSPDGQRILTASADNTARVWYASGQLVVILKGHTRPLRSAAFSLDGRRIVTASADGTVRVWSATTAKTLTTLRGHTSAVNGAVFSPDGQRILTASEGQDSPSVGRCNRSIIGHSQRAHQPCY